MSEQVSVQASAKPIEAKPAVAAPVSAKALTVSDCTGAKKAEPVKQHTAAELRLSPYVMAKLSFLLETSSVEVSGFGICSQEDPLCVEDFQLVSQDSTIVTTDMDSDGIDAYFDRMDALDKERMECGRVWIHTHPGDCPIPSCTDRNTFARVFGQCSWAVMFIISKSRKWHAEMAVGFPVMATIEIPVSIEWGCTFGGVNRQAWLDEYRNNVRPNMGSYDKTQYVSSKSKPVVDKPVLNETHRYEDELVWTLMTAEERNEVALLECTRGRDISNAYMDTMISKYEVGAIDDADAAYLAYLEKLTEAGCDDPDYKAFISGRDYMRSDKTDADLYEEAAMRFAARTREDDDDRICRLSDFIDGDEHAALFDGKGRP